MKSSLLGSKILITREAKQAKEFSRKVKDLDGIPFEVPLLKITCKDAFENQQGFKELGKYKWIFFTSSNGVDCFFQLAQKYENVNLDSYSYAAVGIKTEKALQKHGHQSAFIPTVYNAEVMAKEFIHQYGKGPILLVRGNRSRDILPIEFLKHGIEFAKMEVYNTEFNYEMKNKLQFVLEKNKIDFITFTSPSTVEAFVELTEKIPKTQCVCIGTTTAQRAIELGFKSVITPEQYTTEAMLITISDYIKERDDHND